MKITQSQLRQIIKEELGRALKENEAEAAVADAVDAAIEAGEDPEELAAMAAGAQKKLQDLMGSLDEVYRHPDNLLQDLLFQPVEVLTPVQLRRSVGKAMQEAGAPLAFITMLTMKPALAAAIATGSMVAPGAVTVGVLATILMSMVGKILKNRARLEPEQQIDYFYEPPRQKRPEDFNE